MQWFPLVFDGYRTAYLRSSVTPSQSMEGSLMYSFYFMTCSFFRRSSRLSIRASNWLVGRSESEMDTHFCLPLITATQNAWHASYTGEAAHLLLDHIKNYLPEPGPANPQPEFKQPYARYTAIIQSSGMGKSCTIDEMAKYELVIPIVLRPADSTGRVSCSKSSESQACFDQPFL